MICMKCEKGKTPKRSWSCASDSDGIGKELPKAKWISPGYTSHMKNMVEIEEFLEKLTQKH